MTNPANSKKKEQLAQLKQSEFIFMNTSHVIIVFVMMNQGKHFAIEANTKRERKQCFCLTLESVFCSYSTFFRKSFVQLCRCFIVENTIFAFQIDGFVYLCQNVLK